MDNNYCVYKHTAPNGKVYIGITLQRPKDRFDNGRGYSHNEHFKRAIERYGWSNIKHEIITDHLSRQAAILEEVRLIKEHDSTNYKKGYNLMTGGDGLGTHTQSTREKLRQLNLGKTWTDEMKENQRQKMLGHILPEESKERLRQQRIGSKNPFYGKHHSEEAKAKIRANSNNKKGADNPRAKKVIKFSKSGEFIQEYDAIVVAAKENNILSPYNITASINGRQRTCGGYIWKYK